MNLLLTSLHIFLLFSSSVKFLTNISQSNTITCPNYKLVSFMTCTLHQML
jgi:hypothetical protein